MTGAQYIAEFLQQHGVTDAFGIPGGSILDLLYAIDDTEGIHPHLCYHEQAAGFAALGYAQQSHRLGVAYATKGPGFTNLLTPMADAYFDSTPILFITAHTADSLPQNCRLITDQELDTCAMVDRITKYARRIDSVSDLKTCLSEAYATAINGRQGPVFLDISARILKADLDATPAPSSSADNIDAGSIDLPSIAEAIRNAKRPVIMVGDGINQSSQQSALLKFTAKAAIPVLSSRYCHNLMGDSTLYFGYIGSHGIRYANFILSKSDLILSLGNRLNFPAQSQSFKKITDHARIIRCDVDPGELMRQIPGTTSIQADLRSIMPMLASAHMDYGNHIEWIEACGIIREHLLEADMAVPARAIHDILIAMPDDITIVADVGNNEFWVSRASVSSHSVRSTLYSKSFGALGNAIGKAIGAYYATRRPIVVFTGDQGLQLNIQELQYISQHRLPVTIVILNNYSSGMIRDREIVAGFTRSLHTTCYDGYSTPDFKEIARAYDIQWVDRLVSLHSPQMLEITAKSDEPLSPSLPKGNDCQDMMPPLPEEIYNKLNLI